jgi:hypothetical protein
MSAITLTLTDEMHARLKAHLFPGDGNEAVAFALCTRRAGDRVHRLLVKEIFNIPYEDCFERTPQNVRWNTDAIVPLLEKAEKNNLSVVKIHSHTSDFPQFSTTDDQSDADLLPAIGGWVEAAIPHGSVVMLPDGRMFGRCKSNRADCVSLQRIMVVGDDLRIWHRDLPENFLGEFGASHAQLFGDKTIEELGQLSIAVIGCSGTGSLVIEQLARLGIGELVLVDPDVMSIRNINRIPNSYMKDAELSRPKVEVLAERIKLFGLGTKVLSIAKNLWTADAVNAVAQCDLVFGCMDSIDGRFLLNSLASHYLLPYFDLGVRLEAVKDGPNAGHIKQVCGTVHYLQPGKSSLISRGLVDLKEVAEAGLRRNDPNAHAQQLKDGYISGFQEQRPAVITVNMYIAALAVHELLCRLHPYREQPNSDFASLEFSLRSMEFFPEREEDVCPVLAKSVGKGDVTPLLGLTELS